MHQYNWNLFVLYEYEVAYIFNKSSLETHTLISLFNPASSNESSEDRRLDWKLLEFVRSRDVRTGSGVTLIVLFTSAVIKNIQMT